MQGCSRPNLVLSSSLMISAIEIILKLDGSYVCWRRLGTEY